MRNVFWFVLLIASILAASQFAQARDLVSAANSAQMDFNRIGIACVGIGLTIGGILFSLGAATWGRMMLISGFVGACAIFGAPALLGLLSRIFGMAM